MIGSVVVRFYSRGPANWGFCMGGECFETCELDFFACRWLAQDLFIEHDIDALRGQEDNLDPSDMVDWVPADLVSDHVPAYGP